MAQRIRQTGQVSRSSLEGAKSSLFESGDRMRMWTIEDALPLVRSIAVIGKEHGFSVALYGSVLVAGQSSKDLDLFFIAAENRTSAVHAQACLKAVAEQFGIECPRLTPICTSRIELGDGKRIDAQFLEFTQLANHAPP